MSEKAYQIFGESVCFVGGVALALLFIGAVLCIAAAVWEMARDEWLRIIKVEKLILKFKRHRAEFEAWLAERGADDNDYK